MTRRRIMLLTVLLVVAILAIWIVDRRVMEQVRSRDRPVATPNASR